MKSVVKHVFRKCGMEIKRYRPSSSTLAGLMRMLSSHRVNLVFDVGANAGQFGRSLREGGYHGRIVSFEPLAEPWERLMTISRKDPLWSVAKRAAIGAETGEVEMHVAANSVSSSVLNVMDRHVGAAPESRCVSNECVPLLPLDSIAQDYLDSNSVAFLKIDTQGYEDQVLQGAAELLDRIVGLQVELSFVPLYENQRLFDDMRALVEGNGFELWSVWPVFSDSDTGRLLQVDATFFRP